MPKLSRRLLAAGLAALVLVGGLEAPAQAAGRSAQTSAAEKRRVDRVKTPKLRWYKCYDWAQCATAKLPLDYDDPDGPTTEVALLRVRATNRKKRIGSLFVNPGGPGGSATMMALASPYYLSDSVRDRFDVVGVDPRGVGFSDNVQCFGSTREQTLKLKTLATVMFPMGARQERAYLKSAKALAKGCSTTGKELAGAMSTAEVARDMDVMRRAVGDKKLSYLGFSYGSVLGEYYANMFPDRVRAVAIDGVVNPIAWAGYQKTKNISLDDRLRSADGAWAALKEIFRRCDAAGATHCALAGHSAAKFAAVAARLKKAPLYLGYIPGYGHLKISYADFIGTVFGALYMDRGPEYVSSFTAAMQELITGGLTGDSATKARHTVAKQLGRDFTYTNSYEAYASVMCTDGLHPKKASSWPARAARADRRAPYFGRLWTWASAQCAGDSWTVRDEDAYRGPFTKRTSAPVLIVGSYHDPATAYVGAVQTARIMPNSRLLTSDNWGHTAYGTSPCVTQRMDNYLLYRALPAKGTVCRITERPFSYPLESYGAASVDDTAKVTGTKEEIAARGLPAPGAPKQLPPVAAVLPGR